MSFWHSAGVTAARSAPIMSQSAARVWQRAAPASAHARGCSGRASRPADPTRSHPLPEGHHQRRRACQRRACPGRHLGTQAGRQHRLGTPRRHRPVQHKGGDHAIPAQAGDKGRALPVSRRRRIDQALALGSHPRLPGSRTPDAVQTRTALGATVGTKLPSYLCFPRSQARWFDASRENCDSCATQRSPARTVTDVATVA